MSQTRQPLASLPHSVPTTSFPVDRGRPPRAPMAISRLQPLFLFLLLLLRAFASLPTQAAARGGRGPSGLVLSLPLPLRLISACWGSLGWMHDVSTRS